MRSHASVLGHPLHPLMVIIPVTLVPLALLADLVFIARDKDGVSYDVAFWSAIVFVPLALAAAVPGFIDYLKLPLGKTASATATAHMVINLIVVALMAVSAVFMFDHNATEGVRLGLVVGLHGTATGLILVSGALGGELVYRHGAAVIPARPQASEDEISPHISQPERPVGRTAAHRS